MPVEFTRCDANIMNRTYYLGAKLALIEKIIIDFQHEGRAITHDQINKCV